MRDGNHNLKISLKTLSGFEYKPEVKNKSGSKLTVMDDNGNILHEGEFKSFTANFMKLLYGNMVGAGSVSAKNLVNADTDIDAFPNVLMNVKGGTTKQKFGICVGTGTDAVTNSDYNLTWESGLTYGNVVAGAVSVIGSAITVEFSREISNSSGSTKTLSEAGLVCGVEDDNNDNVLIARDLVSVELLNGKKSTWRYTITVDFESTIGGFVKNFLDSLIISSWTRATANASFSGRRGHASVVFDNKMWVIGGQDTGGAYRNDVWYSSDGATWTQATASASFSKRFYHTSVVFDNKMWVIGGYNNSVNFNDVWYSSDGVTWTRATANASFSGRRGHASVVFDNKMWVIGGYNGSSNLNDVWYSSDGATWTQATASASFSGRSIHTSVVFDNKMWVIGGYDTANLNDVWYSSDGATWTRATANASFSGRERHTSVVFDNKMWVIGGYDTANLNDVWYSSDGATWTQATPSASFYTRAYHTSAVFDNKMWVIGGYNGSYLNDVWYYGKQLDASALITDDTRGILVGSSDASFDETDTALKTKIEHGTGAGQLEYGVMPYTTDTVEPFIDGDKTLMTLARRFENNSGGSVTIKEVGIMSVNGLLCRIIPATPIVVENGASEIITITFESEV